MRSDLAHPKTEQKSKKTERLKEENIRASRVVRAGLIKRPHVRIFLYERFCLHGRGGRGPPWRDESPLLIDTAKRELTREGSSACIRRRRH